MHENPDSPNDRLTTVVVRALVTEGLIPESRRGELWGKVRYGRITPNEWRELAEEGLRSAGGDDAAPH